MITIPRKEPPKYMRRGEINTLARKNQISEWTLRKVFDKDSAARKMLNGRKHPLYVRRVVHELLGLQDESNP